MNLELFYQSFLYVMNDPFFWASMCFTTLIGIFIGSVVYDGDVHEMKKGLIMLGGYSLLLITVNISRVAPEISVVANPYKPIAGISTIFLVSLFYLLGMAIGVIVTKKAHKEL